ncbi:ribonuclease HII [Methanogenium organophilum]|uniref:Ribonuclease HII n=1 Tax=Methanogenium organophilum TaxID=2199 RepID=A0A9X9S719_METOG|nr:ribonuclease HII [Methanogenium organophilum]
MICGVDEAGKGSVLGPMVIAGVSAPDMDIVASTGVADSKTLSRNRREIIYREITENFLFACRIISAEEIDRLRAEILMNEIVAQAHAEVIRKLPSCTAFVDACDVNAERYGRTVGGYAGDGYSVISEHKADVRYAVVSAASVVAKVTRDRCIDLLHEEFGNFGSGYPSDPLTIQFLEDYIKEFMQPPSCARTSWETTRRIMDRLSQATLFDF